MCEKECVRVSEREIKYVWDRVCKILCVCVFFCVRERVRECVRGYV